MIHPLFDASAEQRFWVKVDQSRGEHSCWPWTGHVDPGGYGRFNVTARSGQRRTALGPLDLSGPPQKTWRVHRLAYELLVGPIPDGHTIDHVRDRGCTTNTCCNPRHLEAVSDVENQRRRRRGMNQP